MLATKDDPLAKPIAAQEWAVSAPQLCADLSQATGVKLVCDPRLKEDLVVLVVKSRPAREIMDVVADHFGWAWQPERDGYRLIPTEAFLNEAKWGRYRSLLAEGARNRAFAAKRAAEIRAVRPSAIEEEKKKLEGQVEAETQGGKPDQAALQKLWQRISVLNSLAEPLPRVAYETMAHLSDDQLVALADRPIVMSTDPGPLEVPFPERAQAVIPSVMAALRKRWDEQQREEARAARELEKIRVYTFSSSLGRESARAPLPEAGVLRFALPRPGDAMVTLLTANHEVVDEAEVVFSEQEADAQGNGPSLPPLPPLLAKALLEKLDRESDPPKESDPLRAFGRYMGFVGSRLGVDVVSDAYDRSYGLDGLSPDAESLEYLRRAGFTPRIEGGWLRQRYPNWARARDESAPRRIVKKFREPLDSMSLDERGALTEELAPIQVASPLIPINDDDYWFYRFWAGCPPQVRSALLEGKPLPITALSPSGVEYLYRKAPRYGSGMGFEDGVVFSTGYVSGGVFAEPEFQSDARLSRGFPLEAPALVDEDAPKKPVKRQVDHEFASLYPRFLPASAALTVQRYVVPVLVGPNQLVMSSWELAAHDQGEGSLPVEAEMHPGVVSAMRFHFHLLPDFDVPADASELTIQSRTVKGRSQWPPDLLARIKKQSEIQAQIRSLEQRQQGKPPP